MKNIALVASLAALAAVSTPAYAQDTGWSGPYIGVGGGVSSNNHKEASGSSINGTSGPYDIHDHDVGEWFAWQENLNGAAAGSGHHGRTNIFGTVEAGYDHQIGGGVIGVFANYDFGSRKRTNFSGSGSWAFSEDHLPLDCDVDGENCASAGAPDDVYVYESGPVSINGAVRQKDSWAVGARAGALVGNNNTLLYVTAGYTQTKVQIAGVSTLLADPVSGSYFLEEGALPDSVQSVAWSRSKWRNGYFIGAGAETKVTDNVSVKLEYRYSDLGKMSASGNNSGVLVSEYDEDYAMPISTAGGTNLRKIQRHAVRLVFGYRF